MPANLKYNILGKIGLRQMVKLTAFMHEMVRGDTNQGVGCAALLS